MDSCPFGVNQATYTAIRMAQIFASKPPTVDALRNVFGMTRATAYRWIAAWNAAKDKAA
jgi:hypothetical protein